MQINSKVTWRWRDYEYSGVIVAIVSTLSDAKHYGINKQPNGLQYIVKTQKGYMMPNRKKLIDVTA